MMIFSLYFTTITRFEAEPQGHNALLTSSPEFNTTTTSPHPAGMQVVNNERVTQKYRTTMEHHPGPFHPEEIAAPHQFPVCRP
jgi:hypothetical protein